MIKFLKKYLGQISAAVMALGVLAMSGVARAADFDATDTTSVLTSAIAAVSPTIKYGVGAVLVISLGVWVIFLIAGKLKKHVK